MSVTMIIGSFIAGASSQGGGAVAFPVMTLIYNISPEIARNFSFAIQSIGMTCASYFIIQKKITIEKKYCFLSIIGGAIGLTIGTKYIVPLVTASYVKMLFFSFWLSFAFVLFFLNHIRKRKVRDKLPKLDIVKKTGLIIMSIIGGIFTSITGSGIDIITFSYVTLRYRLSEKVATPTSVIIMTVNSIIGFFIHLQVLKDFGAVEFNFWLVCIPVVIIGAPIGAYVANVLKRLQIAKILYVIIIVQFIGACYIIKPTGNLLIFTISVFICGIVFFLICAKANPISDIRRK